ncbi:PRC-barrel domain protein [Roseiarcus fermentans]|uniref:PRC-barrel domain protein n=1 Tax=Roseiarcus fermentans TaxID=1473586 RepID=A0A366F1U5_9HYPH|nr:PRC-barrel domain-containing protein [Roseiarcus fermentans]RBP08642.1 PRC-barrel domain protein [Roseiarcus fermentans]
MLFAAASLIGCPVAASDGRIGAVEDFLLDDRRWTVRWLVVDTGDWLPGRKVLIHPSAVAPIRLPPRPAFPMLAVGEQMALPVNLTRAQVEASPEAAADEPVTEDMEQRLFDHYGWDPFFSAPQLGGEPAILRPAARAIPAEGPAGGGPRLGSAAALKGFSVHAADGDAGSVDNVFLDDVRWTVGHLVVATRGWLRGRLVRVPITAVASVDWTARSVTLDVARERVESAPVWDPTRVMADDLVEARLREHFGPPERGA